MRNKSLRNDIQERQIRAIFGDQTIRVYQAFNREIARSAVHNQTFVSPPFKTTRMTWIKPSFHWMMYRSGCGHKDLGQERILAIDIDREGFEWALANSVASSYKEWLDVPYEEWKVKKSCVPVVFQWDPERDLLLNKCSHRSLQIGLSGIAVEKYLNEWIVNITDITALAHQYSELLDRRDINALRCITPKERIYLLPDKLDRHVINQMQ